MASGDIRILYDGECPVCSAYVRMTRLKALSTVSLVDLRKDPALVAALRKDGFEPNQGMVLEVGSAHYYGADAIAMMAAMSTRSGIFNRMNYWIFRHKRLSRALYPIMKTGRRALLFILGRKPIPSR